MRLVLPRISRFIRASATHDSAQRKSGVGAGVRMSSAVLHTGRTPASSAAKPYPPQECATQGPFPRHVTKRMRFRDRGRRYLQRGSTSDRSKPVPKLANEKGDITDYRPSSVAGRTRGGSQSHGKRSFPTNPVNISDVPFSSSFWWREFGESIVAVGGRRWGKVVSRQLPSC